MRRRLALTAAALTAVALVAAPGASAATEFGDSCPASGAAPSTAPGYTLTTLAAPPGGLPAAAPGNGVITKVTTNMGLPIPFKIPLEVKVLRPAGGTNYTVVGQTTMQIGQGLTAVDARLPVKAGDLLGLYGLPTTYEGSAVPSLSPFCEATSAGYILGAAEGDVAPGATASFEGVTEGRVPLVGVIEPDADNDGYGDETQDKCPTAAAIQVACPVSVIDIAALPGSGAVTVLVASSVAAPISVSATVPLPPGGKKTKQAGASAQLKLKKVTHEVAAGKVGKFRLKFPGPLKSALATLPPGKSLKLTATATTTNVAGVVSKDSAKLKLKSSG